jgi:hypothetical protein
MTDVSQEYALLSLTWKQAVHFPSIIFYHTTRHHFPENNTIHNDGHEYFNLKRVDLLPFTHRFTTDNFLPVFTNE